MNKSSSPIKTADKPATTATCIADSTGPVRLLRQYQQKRASGNTITLGVCPCCGRDVRLSMASKNGSRCSYEGAKFDINGAMISSGVPLHPVMSVNLIKAAPDLLAECNRFLCLFEGSHNSTITQTEEGIAKLRAVIASATKP